MQVHSRPASYTRGDDLVILHGLETLQSSLGQQVVQDSLPRDLSIQGAAIPGAFTANLRCDYANLNLTVSSKLAALFLERYCPPSTVWMVIGFGLRIMQEHGAHRKTFSANTVLERELWKRAFW